MAAIPTLVEAVDWNALLARIATLEAHDHALVNSVWMHMSATNGASLASYWGPEILLDAASERANFDGHVLAGYNRWRTTVFYRHPGGYNGPTTLNLYLLDVSHDSLPTFNRVNGTGSAYNSTASHYAMTKAFGWYTINGAQKFVSGYLDFVSDDPIRILGVLLEFDTESA